MSASSDVDPASASALHQGLDGKGLAKAEQGAQVSLFLDVCVLVFK
jgi:hypothetical protein